MGHGISGERQRATCQEAFLPAVCFLDESAPAQVRHPCCPPLPGRDSEPTSETLASYSLLICHKTLSKSFAS